MGLTLKKPVIIKNIECNYLGIYAVAMDSPKERRLVVNFLLWRSYELRKNNPTEEPMAGISLEWTDHNPAFPNYPLDGTGVDYFTEIYDKGVKTYFSELQKIATLEAMGLGKPDLYPKILQNLQDRYFGCINEGGFEDAPSTKEKD